MSEGNINQEFRLKNVDYLIEEVNQNELIRVLNYIEHLLILISIVTGCVSISAFISLVGISVGITSSAIGVKICVITAEIKKYKSIIKRKKKNHDKILSLATSKLNSVEVLISKASFKYYSG